MCYKWIPVWFATIAAAQQPELWRDPGPVARLDFVGGAGGRSQAPQPPFLFLHEDLTGTSAKVRMRHAARREWSVKWGPEVKAETFASRLAWAAGYFVEPVYYYRKGRIQGVRDLGRAGRYIGKSGEFSDARFELIDRRAKYSSNGGWTWKRNPFLQTRELNGLKIIVMLTSNWDNKDSRDPSSNTAILHRGSGSNRRQIYLVSDWGGSMGRWGNFFTREKWDCDGYTDQTREFIKTVKEGEVGFGFTGQHDSDFKDDITVRDVRWLMKYLVGISDSQIRAGLRASGANTHEQQCFGKAIRQRLTQLGRVARL